MPQTLPIFLTHACNSATKKYQLGNYMYMLIAYFPRETEFISSKQFYRLGLELGQ